MNHTIQQLLPTFEPSEADLVERALAQPLDAKIRRSVGLLRMYEQGALKMSPDGYYLAFSGGKDSCVIKQLAIESGVKFKSYYNLTTIDPPELVQFIKRQHHEVAWNKPAKPMMERLIDRSNGPPTRLVRWCCAEYKEQGGSHMFKIIGVRVAESARRAATWREFVPNRNKGSILAPIAYWTDEDVWAFIRSRNLSYCELYDQGFKRLGCIGCPLAGREGQYREFARWPKYERMWKRAVFKFYDRWHLVPINRPFWEKLGPRDLPHKLATKFGTAIVTDADEAERLGVKIGAEVRTQYHWWRYFEDFGSAQGLWDWWRSGKASEGEADCTYEEMMMNV